MISSRRLRWISGTGKRWVIRPPVEPHHPILYYLRQPFLFRFDCRVLPIYTATKEEIGLCSLHDLMIHRSRAVTPFCPYSGKLSRGCRGPHNNNDLTQEVAWTKWSPLHNVRERVQQPVEPVQDLTKDHGGHVYRPTEGMLLQRSAVRGGREVVWRSF